MISYTIHGSKGQLDSTRVFFDTGVLGHEIHSNCIDLSKDGILTVKKGFVWDFGSGAIDTPAVVVASLAHDAFCVLTDSGALPWRMRKKADKYFYRTLRENGEGWLRSTWLYIAVRAYSKYKGLSR